MKVKTEKSEKVRRRKKVKHDTAFDYVNIALLVVLALLCLYPMWFVIVGSFNKGYDYLKGGVYFWPRTFTWANYAVVLADNRIWQGLLMTVIRCLIGPVLHIFLCSLVAYGMSRKELHGKKFFNIFGLITMFFSGGLVPFYVLCKMLGMLNTFAMYILPGAYSVYNMILIRSFIKGIPEELHEAAVLDGAGEFRIYFTMIIPLSMPILMTVLLWGILGHWNDYTTTMFYTPSNRNIYTLQYILMLIIQEGNVQSNVGSAVSGEAASETISLAAMVIGTIPMLIAFPFLQKYFTKGLYVGSLKG
jgi:putative aldouronate transport system permease protein